MKVCKSEDKPIKIFFVIALLMVCASLASADYEHKNHNGTLTVQYETLPDNITLEKIYKNGELIAQFHYQNGERIAAGPTKVTGELIQGTPEDDNGISRRILEGTNSNDVIKGLTGDDILYGGAGDDQLYGDEDDDKLYGEAGNDQLYGGEGKDHLDGGAGNDTLRGGPGDGNTLSGASGHDTYLFGPEDGDTTISNLDHDHNNIDILRFLSGIDPDDITVSSNTHQLLLTLNTGAVITIPHFQSPNYELDVIEFADGTRWEPDDIQAMMGNIPVNQIDGTEEDDFFPALRGTSGVDLINGKAGNDRIYGYAGDDTINGDDGNDSLYGDDGDDTINGGEGKDLIEGGNGDDILRGGPGDGDTLAGEQGADTYLYASGDGDTLITPYDTVNPGEDILRFLDVTEDEVEASREEDDLLLTLSSTGEIIRVEDFFENANSELAAIEFSDGASWNTSTIAEMAEPAEPIQLLVKALLQGPYNNSAGLMNDNLRTDNLIPTTEPYTAMGDNAGTSQTLSATSLAETGDNAVVDWVLLELRNENDPSTIEYAQAVIVQRDGDLALPADLNETLELAGVSDGNYYVSVRHRNHLGVMTDAPVSLQAGTPASVDFTSTSTATRGDHAQNITNGLTMMWAGDASRDQRVIYQGPDNDANYLLSAVLLAPGNSSLNNSYILDGYLNTDINLDGHTIFSGPGNDNNTISFNVYLHPENSSFSPNFILRGGMHGITN